MKLTVVGSLNIDVSVKCDKVPAFKETMRGNEVRFIPGGKGANQAVAMAKLGAQTEMLGCVGDDVYADFLIDNLKSYSVKTDHIRKTKNVSSGTAVIMVAGNDNTMVIIDGANSKTDTDYIQSVKDSILDSDMVLLQCEIPAETVEYVIRLCYNNHIKTILNPAPVRRFSTEIIEMATYITPNEQEAAAMFGTDIEIRNALKKYPEKLIVTQGSRGICTCKKSGEIIKVPTFQAEVVDTTGAGDTFNGAFAVAISQGIDYFDALKFANAAASISISKFGAQCGMPTREEVEQLL